MKLESLYHRAGRFVTESILGVNDSPHRIALGAAIGIFIAWTPTIPFQMTLTFIFAAILGANKLVGQPIVWITNPVTAVPIYYFNYLVGCWIIPGEHSLSDFGAKFSRIINSTAGVWERVVLSWNVSLEFFWPLWIGSVVVGLILAVPTYILTFHLVARYQGRQAQGC